MHLTSTSFRLYRLDFSLSIYLFLSLCPSSVRVGLEDTSQLKIIISSLQFSQISTPNIINNLTFANLKTIIILKNNILNFILNSHLTYQTCLYSWHRICCMI
ncbi:hypothetical protein I3760_05G029100 [Carya illinoinensis]|nr:hypothetical protein I3760_05G029100 [Carya illinoinensis]